MSDLDDSSIIAELRCDGTTFGKIVSARMAALMDEIDEEKATNADLLQALDLVRLSLCRLAMLNENIARQINADIKAAEAYLEKGNKTDDQD